MYILISKEVICIRERKNHWGFVNKFETLYNSVHYDRDNMDGLSNVINESIGNISELINVSIKHIVFMLMMHQIM